MNEVPTTRSLQPSDDLRLREFAGIIRRHRWFLVVSLVVGAALGAALGSMRDPRYQASTLILVRGESLLNLSALGSFGEPSDAGRVSTEMELLQSRALAGAVVDSLELQLEVVVPRRVTRSHLFSRIDVSPDAAGGKYRFRRGVDGLFAVVDTESGRSMGSVAVGERLRLPHAEVVLAEGAEAHEEIEVVVRSRVSAVSALTSALKVAQPGSDASLISVRYSGTDPELVRDIPNALTARFTVLRESMQKSEARSTVTLLREQLNTLAAQLTESEGRLREFREAEQVIDPEVEAASRISHLADLQAQRAMLAAERSSLAAVLSDVRSAARANAGSTSPYRRLIAFPSLLRNNAVSEMLRSLATMEERRIELLARRSTEDPEVQALTAQIGRLESQLQGMASTYLDGLNGQLAAIDGTLGQYRAQLAQTPGKEAEFGRLSRQPQVLQQMYGQLQTRLKEAEIAEAVDNSSVRVVDAADLPQEPSGPGRGLFAGLAGTLGLLFGLGLVLVREYADSTVHSRADVQAAVGIPVLGLIPRVGAQELPRWSLRSLPNPRLLLPRSASSASRGERRAGSAVAPMMIVRNGRVTGPLSDAFGRLHANVMFSRPGTEMKVLLLTSALPGDGKTTTAVNFATALAQAGLRVLLIDADLRRGTVHQAFGVPRGPGLADLLSENPVFAGALRVAEVGEGRRLRYITAGSGTGASDPVQMLGSPVMRELLAGAAGEYDRIIIDTPPLNLFPDAAVLGAAVDGVLVVARAGVTPFDALVDTAEELRRATSPVVGAVLNEVDFEREVTYDRSYRWYSLTQSYHAGAGVAE